MRLVHYGWWSVLAAALAVIAPAHAQYPTRPIRLIVTFAPGGAADTAARIVAQGLSEALGRQVLVDNRVGAGGNVGAEIAAKSPPDGYTVLLGNVSHAISVSFYSKPNYNVLKDFAPVTLLASAPLVAAVHPSVPAKSVKELITLARARPNQLDFASPGTGGGVHLAGVLFCEMAGIKMNHVPFKGGAPAMIAVMAGHVSVGFSSLSAAMPHMSSGKLRVLAVTSAQRSPSAPELSTVSEAGLKGYEAGTWYGFMVPAGTPKVAVSRLHTESVKLIKQPSVRERLQTAGLDAIGSTPEEFGSYIRSEVEKWGKVLKASGARPD